MGIFANILYHIGPLRYICFKAFYTDQDHIKSISELMYDIRSNQQHESQVTTDLQRVITHLSYVQHDKYVSDYIKDNKFFATYSNDIVKLCLSNGNKYEKVVDYAVASARYWDSLSKDQLSHLVKVAAEHKDIHMVQYLLNKQHIVLSLEDGFKIVEHLKNSESQLKHFKIALLKESDDIDNILYDFYYDNIDRHQKEHVLKHYEHVIEATNNYLSQYASYGMIKEDLHYNDAPYIRDAHEHHDHHDHHDHHHHYEMATIKADWTI